MELLLLGAVVFVAFLVEAATGFGSVLVALTVGALWFPVTTLLGWLVPVNLVLSTYLVTRGWRSLDRVFLLRRALPLMIAGLAVGTVVTQVVDASALKPVFAGFVVAVALWQVRVAMVGAQTRPLAAPVRVAALFGAGLVHGMFATGGPLAVLVAARELTDKAAFRATLSAVWVVLNLLVLPRLAHDGAVSLSTLRVSAVMLVPLALGIAAGEWAHHLLDERRFRVVVGALLVAGGAVLLVSSLSSASAPA